MIEVADLPRVNAFLNGTAAVLLVSGWLAIRRRRVRVHAAFMIAAGVASALFLTSYLVYHAHAGSKRYPGEGALRALYFAILISHTVLAVVNVPLVIVAFARGLRLRRRAHRRVARIALPVWLYVSVTGILVYLMLYVWV